MGRTDFDAPTELKRVYTVNEERYLSEHARLRATLDPTARNPTPEGWAPEGWTPVREELKAARLAYLWRRIGCTGMTLLRIGFFVYTVNEERLGELEIWEVSPELNAKALEVAERHFRGDYESGLL